MARLRHERDKLAAKEAKLLVKVVRVILQDANADHSPLPTQHFVVCTEDGPIDSTFSIDQLQRCNPPPDAQLYRVVDFDLSALAPDKSGRKRRAYKLSRAYRRFITLTSVRLNTAIRINNNKLASSQDALVSSGTALEVLADLTTSSSPTGVTDDSESVTDSPPLTPPPPSAVPPKKIPCIDLLDDPQPEKVEHPPLPCTHCKETLEWAEYIFCHYTPCSRPFHSPTIGCTKRDQVVVVNQVQRYCSMQCAQQDNSGELLPSQPLSQSLPVHRSTSIAMSQPLAPSSQNKPPTACSSCLEPVQWSRGGTGCDTCRAYHHRVPRGGEGCTRAGWTKGGSRNVDGNVTCVPCRFKTDKEWIEFSKERRDGED
jgi:hypothetical protein